mmetsp:Transcript_12478/g.28928  ORF Transcript_12478/g.28928 Transcript_12478/m.28928 type:complete len:129 (+) Transcript_12478:555-941(+)
MHANDGERRKMCFLLQGSSGAKTPGPSCSMVDKQMQKGHGTTDDGVHQTEREATDESSSSNGRETERDDTKRELQQQFLEGQEECHTNSRSGTAFIFCCMLLHSHWESQATTCVGVGNTCCAPLLVLF